MKTLWINRQHNQLLEMSKKYNQSTNLQKKKGMPEVTDFDAFFAKFYCTKSIGKD